MADEAVVDFPHPKFVWRLACGCELTLGVQTLDRPPKNQAWCAVHNAYDPRAAAADGPTDA